MLREWRSLELLWWQVIDIGLQSTMSVDETNPSFRTYKVPGTKGTRDTGYNLCTGIQISQYVCYNDIYPQHDLIIALKKKNRNKK